MLGNALKSKYFDFDGYKFFKINYEKGRKCIRSQ